MDASHTDTSACAPPSMTTRCSAWMPLAVLTLLTASPACSGAADFSGAEALDTTFLGETGDGDGSDTGATEGPSDTMEPDPGDGDGDLCDLDCGEGTCVDIDGIAYCECPDDTEWAPGGCEACPVVADAAHDLELELVSFEGRFLLQGMDPPNSEYDDANLWLENPRTGDRVWLGNTHDAQFSVRVTPGIYEVIYEVETPGDLLPHNPRIRLEKLALFAPIVTQNIDIGVATRSGAILLNGDAPPVDEYDDARLLFRDQETGNEVLAGNTHDGSYAVSLVPGSYDIIYRVETPGQITPRNDGAAIATVPMVAGAEIADIEITSVPLHGAFTINTAPAPPDEYNDANIELDSATDGLVRLGNTHDGDYALEVIPGSYTLVYRHETGQDVPQNTGARFGTVDVDAMNAMEPVNIDIPMVALAGALTINGAAPPPSEFDDGVLRLLGVDSDDSVLLGNTHDGNYLVQVIPGSYDVFYGQETAGGTVPYNKHARVAQGVVVAEAGNVDIDVEAVTISGAITVGGSPPPTSEYDDGRIYLRNMATGDAVLLGSTHDGGYSALVVPGDYEIFYVQEAGGAVLPGNQDALLAGVSIGGATSIDLDVPVVELGGEVLVGGEPAPTGAGDGGQLYLRTLDGDSVLLGDSFAGGYGARLVAGTYGVYYRSVQSVTMPQNENGRFACLSVE